MSRFDNTRTPDFTRASRILPSHRFAHSVGGPLVRVAGRIETLFPAPGNHHGANHQHMVVAVEQVLTAEGIDAGQVAPRLFVAIRFGDSEGLEDAIPLQQDAPVELQGEYVDSAEAYASQDNDPPLPVLHFTHHPVGYVLYGGRTYS